MPPSDAKLLLVHLPAVAAVLVGGPFGAGGLGYGSGDPGRESRSWR